MDNDTHEIGALLSAPLRALQQAQISAEREYLSFLMEYGLEEVIQRVNGKQISSLRLREVSFGMTRSIADPSSPGQVVDTLAIVRAPLVSLVQMPAISISEATVELTLDVETERRKTGSPEGLRGALLPPNFQAEAVLKGRVGSGQVSRNFRTAGKLSVRLTLRASHADDIHSRLSRVLAEGLSTTITVPDKR